MRVLSARAAGCPSIDWTVKIPARSEEANQAGQNVGNVQSLERAQSQPRSRERPSAPAHEGNLGLDRPRLQILDMQIGSDP